MNNTNQSCDHHAFFEQQLNQTSQCEQLARNACSTDYQFINFYSMTYCYMNGAWGGFIPLIFVFVFFIFRFISSVVEEYLAPSIAYITEWLHLSEAMGAVTLLALANGAGDVVTAIVASTSPTGISYNIGSLYGAGLFVTTLVVGVTILKSGPNGVQLEAASIWRDVGFYIIATIMIIIFGIIGSLGLVDAFLLLGLYVLLVLTVFIQEKFFPTKHEDSLDDSETDQSLVLIPGSHQDALYLDDHDIRPKQEVHGMARFKKAVNKVKVQNLTKKITNMCIVRLQKLRERKERESSFSSMDLMDKIFFIIDQPFNYVRKLTMPPAEEEDYSKVWCCVSIAPGLIAITWILTQTFYWYYLYGLLPLGLLISAAIWFTSPDDRPPVYYIVLQIYASFGSIIWTYLVSGILIDLLNFVGMLTNLSPTYLGLTVIAMGNALPDAVVTIALAQQGYAIMGMTGAFAGQLFGLLVGLGLAVLRRNLAQDTAVFQLFTNISENIVNIHFFSQYFFAQIMMLVIFTTLGTLTATFAYGIHSKYLFDRKLAYILLASYGTLFVTVTIIAIVQAFHPPS